MNRKAFLPIIIFAFLSPIPNAFADSYNTNANTEAPSSSTNSPQKEHRDAIAIILQDHAEIRKMIAQLNKTLDSNVAQARSDFKELKNFLIQHETMEQKVWYPALEKYDDLKNIISMLKKEEQDASDEIKDLDSITDDKKWASKVTRLFKDVDHHATDEETKLFPKVKKLLDQPALDQIGDKIQEYKSQNQS